MAITPLPTPPSRSAPSTFSTLADAFIAALPVFVTESNAQAAALTLNDTTDASTSSVAIGTGAKTFTVTAAKSFQPGMWLVIADDAAPSTNAMYGTVTSYATDQLVMDIKTFLGTGTKSAWTISQSAPGGLTAGGALGTPASGVLTNCTGLPIAQVYNLKPVVNAAVNKLDIFSKTGGAAFDATNYLTVAIPDGNGFTLRNRAAAVASGTGQIILADAANYWSKGSLDAEIKTAYLYAIWSAADGGIVFALNGYSGFTRCPVSVTATDDDFFLLEESSTYTKVITDYCVCVGKIRYQYDTADAPDHTIQATVLDAPQVMWNPKSDYGYQKNLATTNTSANDISEYAAVNVTVKQPGKYFISARVYGIHAGSVGRTGVVIKTGSATYGSATARSQAVNMGANYNGTYTETASCSAIVLLNIGDVIHLGADVVAASGNRILMGVSDSNYGTGLTFNRID